MYLCRLISCWVIFICGAGTEPYKIYPNPAQDYILIKGGSGELMNIIISDASGRTLREGRVNEAEDKLKLNLQSGIYFVILTDRNGLSQTKKLVIVR